MIDIMSVLIVSAYYLTMRPLSLLEYCQVQCITIIASCLCMYHISFLGIIFLFVEVRWIFGKFETNFLAALIKLNLIYKYVINILINKINIKDIYIYIYSFIPNYISEINYILINVIII